MTFEQNISLVQYLIPPICAGILIGGIVLYSYMYIRYRSIIYIAITLNALCALVFTGSEAMILSLGGLMNNREIGTQFHRMEQLSGVYFLFALPFILEYLLNLDLKWQRINRVMKYIGLGVALITTVMAFSFPDSFISMVQHKATWLRYQADYGRGQEGALYQLRDAMLGIYIIYAMVSIGMDMVKNRNIKDLVFPAIGLFLSFAGAIIDTSFVYTGINFDFLPHVYYSRFSVGITLMVVFFISTITKRFIDATMEVERVHKIITLSEERYRRLVEGTNDCIFSLDLDLNILSANGSALAQLSIDEDRIREINFYDLLFIDPDDLDITRQLVQDKISLFLTTKKPVSFKAMLKTRVTNEPKEYRVVFESIETDDRNEILMKAMGFADDTLMKYIETEKMSFAIGNYLTAADEISKRLVLNLPKYLKKQQIMNLRIGLREIIFNAIEHGNLNISFEEKTEATMTSDYIQFIHERQKDNRYKNKKVFIEFSFTPERVRYKITDEGNGFDYRQMIDYIKNNADMGHLAHGRGLTMAFNIFDEVEFNRKGNQVLLTKHFNNIS